MSAEEMLRKCGLTREAVEGMQKKVPDAEANERKYANVVTAEDRLAERLGPSTYGRIAGEGFDNGKCVTRKGTYLCWKRKNKRN